MRLILDLVHVKDHPIYERTFKNWYYLRARREGDDLESPFVFILPVGGDYKTNPVDGFSFIAQVTRWLVNNEDPKPRLMPLEAIPECAWEDYMRPETGSPERVRKPETEGSGKVRCFVCPECGAPPGCAHRGPCSRPGDELQSHRKPKGKCPGCGVEVGEFHRLNCPSIGAVRSLEVSDDPDEGPEEARPDTEGGSDERPSTESSRP